MNQSSRTMNDGITRDQLHEKSNKSIENRNSNIVINQEVFDLHSKNFDRIIEERKRAKEKASQQKDSETKEQEDFDQEL